LKIGIYAHWNVNWDGATLRMVGCDARYVRHYLELAECVRLFTTVVPHRRPENSEAISDARLEVVPLPGCSFVSTWMRQRRVRQVLSRKVDGLDAVYARLFDPCPWLLAPLCESRQVGLVYHLVGNAIEGIRQRRDWSRAGRWVRRLIFLPEELLVFRAARRHSLLINGSDLARQFGPRHPHPETVISSSLEESDFFQREDTCGTGTARILYAGMLRPAKRVETLIDAVASLVQHGRRLQVRIVGSGDPPSHVAALKDRVRRLGLEPMVHFAGYVPLGEPLQREYRNADLFVMPSITEGSPRALLEAAASSLPCVTTDVGSARDLFLDEESALIIPPDDPAVMARAIARFLDEPELRRRCIRNAYATATRYTCRAFICHIVQKLRESADHARIAARRRSPSSVQEIEGAICSSAKD
jgi:glycosyltransferase involved in cell wall biosynthesis